MRSPDIPGYDIIEQLGRGGFGAVYRAVQRSVGREVALKVALDEVHDETRLARFQREGLSMGRLSWHPNIVQVFDQGLAEGGKLPFLAMELLEQGSLADRLRVQGPLSADDVTRWTIQLCGALAAAHDGRLLHRDIKPDNILLGHTGEAKLADFGIARVADASASTRGSRTEGHAPPEILDGGAPSPQSDLYSLGSTLFQLLTGELPFHKPDDASPVTGLFRVLTKPVPDLREWQVNDNIADAVGWAMAKAADERPPSAEAFGQALQAVRRAMDLPPVDMILPTVRGPGRSGNGGRESEPLTVGGQGPPTQGPDGARAPTGASAADRALEAQAQEEADRRAREAEAAQRRRDVEAARAAARKAEDAQQEAASKQPAKDRPAKDRPAKDRPAKDQAAQSRATQDRAIGEKDAKESTVSDEVQRDQAAAPAEGSPKAPARVRGGMTLVVLVIVFGVSQLAGIDLPFVGSGHDLGDPIATIDGRIDHLHADPLHLHVATQRPLGGASLQVYERVNPTAGPTFKESIDLPGPQILDLAATDTTLWVVMLRGSQDSELLAVDRVTRSVTVVDQGEFGLDEVAVVDGVVWHMDRGTGGELTVQLVRRDASSGAILQVVADGTGFGMFAIDEEVAWFRDSTGFSAFDAATGDPVGRVDVDATALSVAAVGDGRLAISASGRDHLLIAEPDGSLTALGSKPADQAAQVVAAVGQLWLRLADNQLSNMSLATGEELASYGLPDGGAQLAPFPPFHLAVAADSSLFLLTGG